MEIKDILGIGLGATGTALGLINLWRDVRKGQPRLHVSCAPAFDAGNGFVVSTTLESAFNRRLADSCEPKFLSFEVRNIGKISAFIESFGLLDNADRLALSYLPHLRDKFPMELKSGQSWSESFLIDDLDIRQLLESSTDLRTFCAISTGEQFTGDFLLRERLKVTPMRSET